jgi:hypothetical protein
MASLLALGAMICGLLSPMIATLRTTLRALPPPRPIMRLRGFVTSSSTSSSSSNNAHVLPTLVLLYQFAIRPVMVMVELFSILA